MLHMIVKHNWVCKNADSERTYNQSRRYNELTREVAGTLEKLYKEIISTLDQI
jgi:hypothetical protein